MIKFVCQISLISGSYKPCLCWLLYAVGYCILLWISNLTVTHKTISIILTVAPYLLDNCFLSVFQLQTQCFWWQYVHVVPENIHVPPPLESRDRPVVRALASHQCVPGSIPGPGNICGLGLLLVLFLVPRPFSLGIPGTLVPPSRPGFSIDF